MGNIEASQRVFYQHALDVGAIQHGEIVGSEERVALHGRSDFVGHPIRLVSVARGSIRQHFPSAPCGLPMRTQHLAGTMRIAGDHLVGSVQNVLSGAVVFFQEHGLDAGELALKLADVADIGAPEAIDGLVGVSHHANVAPPAAKLQDDAVLRRVRVLVFVHQDVLKLVLMPLQHIGMLAKQIVRFHQQIVKIHRPGVFQLLLIHAIDGGDLLRVEDAALLGDLGESVGREQIVLGFADRVAETAHGQPLRVDPQLAEHELENPIGISHVVDGKLLWVAELRGMTAKNPSARRMEGRDPHLVDFGGGQGDWDTALIVNAISVADFGSPACAADFTLSFRVADRAADAPRLAICIISVTQQLRHSLFHFVGGFVGECDSQNPIVRHLHFADEIGDAPSNHTSLARPSPRHHEQRPFAVRHSFKLARVEVSKQTRRHRRYRSTRRQRRQQSILAQQGIFSV